MSTIFLNWMSGAIAMIGDRAPNLSEWNVIRERVANELSPPAMVPSTTIRSPSVADLQRESMQKHDEREANRANDARVRDRQRHGDGYGPGPLAKVARGASSTSDDRVEDTFAGLDENDVKRVRG